MDTLLLYRIIVILLILIGASTYIIITRRKYRRLIEKEMEKIRMGNIERHNRELRRRETAEDFLTTINRDEESGIEPPKHIRRHSIR